jgi:hypothetical protein
VEGGREGGIGGKVRRAVKEQMEQTRFGVFRI